MLLDKRQWVKLLGAFGMFLVCTACGLTSRPAAPVQNTAPSAENDGQEESQQESIPKETQKTDASGNTILTAGGREMKVIEEQSFDVTLEDWGNIRFLSCEPVDGEGPVRFLLAKDGKTIYEFQTEDESPRASSQLTIYDSRNHKVRAEGVNFVTFPDLNGDGRKDAVMSMKLVSDDKGGGTGSFDYAVVYRGQGDQFVINQELTDVINEAGRAGTVENVMKQYDKYWAKTANKAADFSVSIQECVRKDDRERLIGMVRYPITVTVKGKEVTFKNEHDLTGRYEDVFNQEFKAAVAAADPYKSGTGDSGYQLGDGLAVFIAQDDGSFKITRLNSDLKEWR